MEKIYGDDQDIQYELLGMAIWDRQWLKSVGDMITQDDFRPISNQSTTISWVLAGIALEFFRKHDIPIGSLLAPELKKWFNDSGASEGRKKEIITFVKKLKSQYDPSRSEIMRERVRDFRKGQQRKAALKELIELQKSGDLTDEQWIEIMRRPLNGPGEEIIRDYTEELMSRIERRQRTSYRRVPILMIDPLDIAIRAIGRGQIGLWLAPYKMGKSLALTHCGVSYLFQSLNVMYFTLEDPIDETEDRMDACITEMIIDDLGQDGPRVERRFGRFKDKLSAGLKIIDGTDGGISISQVESIWEKQRAAGFDADVVIIDYDDEIRTAKRKERREEFADIYRAFRSFCARKKIIGWTAAQAKREAEGKEVISGNYVAEDISKIRKVTIALGIGQSEWGQDARHIYVAAHKFDRQKFGVDIWSAPEKGMFYDAEKTLQWMRRKSKAPKDL